MTRETDEFGLKFLEWMCYSAQISLARVFFLVTIWTALWNWPLFEEEPIFYQQRKDEEEDPTDAEGEDVTANCVPGQRIGGWYLQTWSGWKTVNVGRLSLCREGGGGGKGGVDVGLM